MADHDRMELRARATEVVARLRFSRWSTLRADAVAVLVAILLPAIPVLFALMTRFEPRRVLRGAARDSAVATGLVVIVLGLIVLGMIALLLAGGMTFAMGVSAVIVGFVTGPWALLVWWSRRQAEAQLLRSGEVPASWASGRRWRLEALARLEAEDTDLVRIGGGLSLRPAPARLHCDGCGAWLRAAGRGLWRCEHCGRERYDERPRMSEELEAARGRVGNPAGFRSRWALFVTVFRREASEGFELFRWGGRIAAWVFGMAALGDLVWLASGKPMNPVSMLALVGITLGMLPICGSWAWGLYEVLLAALTVRPGLRAYDDALAKEILRLVFMRGRIGLDELATHLDVSVPLLRSQVSRLEAYGRLPLFRDRAAETLLALHVRGAVTNECPVCRGLLEVVAGARQRCAHCGGVSLGAAA